MSKYIFVVIVIAIVGGLHFINPTFEEHKLALSSELATDDPIWDGLNYKDYFLVSFMSDVEMGGSMVTYGLCKYVKVVDEEWVTNHTKKRE